MHASTEGIPEHVPLERVVDVDIYRMPGSKRDLHVGWKELHNDSAFGLLWTPRNGGHWIVTRGEYIARVYAEHETFSSNITIVPRKFGEMFPLRPTTLDPPLHGRLRKPINAALSGKTVRSAEPAIRATAIEAIERVRARGRCEFIRDVAEEIPLRVFMHLAELPIESAHALPCYGEQPVESETPIMDRFAGFLRPHIAQRRRHPGGDILSRIANSEDNGRLISDDEAVDVATAVLTGGLDTVVSMLAMSMAFLARSPGHRARLVAEPALMQSAVGELLRRFPIMTKARLLKRDCEIEGVRLKADDMIVMPPLHGLDERELDDPLTVDFDRPPASHSTFGKGVHRCPGAFLTQIEMIIFLTEWLRRIPEFEIDPLKPPKMRGGILGTVLELGLKWDSASTRTAGN